MWALPNVDIAAILAPFEENEMNDHTQDWSDADIEAFVAMARRLGAAPLDLAGCWMSESGLSTKAHNPNGDASGLFQVMPATLVGLGFVGSTEYYRSLSVAEQLRWAERYYAPHKGQLVSPGACYLATFLPAFMPHAAQPLFVLCSTTLHSEWYRANPVFDHDHKGYITVQDLTDQVRRATVGPRWSEFAARVVAAMQDRTTDPEIQVQEETRDVPPGDGDGTLAETFPHDTDPPPEAA